MLVRWEEERTPVSLTSEGLVIGTPGDAERSLVGKLGLKLYDKDLLTIRVLQVELDIESPNFIINVPIKEEKDV